MGGAHGAFVGHSADVVEPRASEIQRLQDELGDQFPEALPAAACMAAASRS